MSKYVMNKFIRHVNMNEAAEKEYKENPRAYVEKWEKNEKLRLPPPKGGGFLAV
ncbi:MAG TPA: hypothetical protein VNL14_01770 [Candidatus Acidoferrales bacterium]|nr:hypothetical protein [Candidatus Acidoferrales bacterium]